MTAIKNPPGNRTEVSVWIRILRSPWSRLALFVGVLTVLGWFALSHGTGTLEVARDWTVRLGVTGATLYVLVFALATLALFPATPLMTAAGLLYGPVVGVLLVWAGSMLGAIGSFLLGRVLSRHAVEQLAGKRIVRLNELFTDHGIATVMLMRLIPVFPFALVNYGSAITAITFRQYLIATAIGSVPATVAYVWLGEGIDDPTSPAFLAAVAILLILTVVGFVAARRLSHRP
ncbi:MAG: TVP38/TMEM64 family protein [Pseudonocardiaceae bacterium]